MKSFKYLSYLLGASPLFVCVTLGFFHECGRSFALFGSGFFFIYLMFSRYWILPLSEIIETIESYEKKYRDELSKMAPIKRRNPFHAMVSTLYLINERAQNQLQYAREKDREIQGMLDSLDEGVIIINAHAEVITMNLMACTMFDLPKNAILGASLQSVAGSNPLLKRAYELMIKTLQTSEIVTEKRQEKGVYFELVTSPLIHQAGAILVLRDKTADHKVLEMGKDFIANASHELRTPITVIQGFTEMLQSAEKLSHTMIREISEKIHRTSLRMNHLIQSLLTLADLENGRAQCFESVDLINLAENCKRLLLTAYPKVSCHISYQPAEICLFADANLLELAMMNLLENAAKYSSSDAEIDLCLEETKGGVQITVRDRGIGIPTLDLPHIFSRFYTVDKARSRKAGGAGLGLSIVNAIVKKHRGKIHVESRFGGGSEFSMRFPRGSVFKSV